MYVRRVAASTQVAAGGRLQAASIGEYEHAPDEQVPVEAYMRVVVEFARVATGGVLQGVSVGAYVQLPVSQVPTDAKVRLVDALAQVATGGILQVTPAQESHEGQLGQLMSRET